MAADAPMLRYRPFFNCARSDTKTGLGVVLVVFVSGEGGAGGGGTGSAVGGTGAAGGAAGGAVRIGGTGSAAGGTGAAGGAAGGAVRAGGTGSAAGGTGGTAGGAGGGAAGRAGGTGSAAGRTGSAAGRAGSAEGASGRTLGLFRSGLFLLLFLKSSTFAGGFGGNAGRTGLKAGGVWFRGSVGSSRRLPPPMRTSVCNALKVTIEAAAVKAQPVYLPMPSTALPSRENTPPTTGIFSSVPPRVTTLRRPLVRRWPSFDIPSLKRRVVPPASAPPIHGRYLRTPVALIFRFFSVASSMAVLRPMTCSSSPPRTFVFSESHASVTKLPS